MREQKEDLFNKKRETIEGGKMSGSNLTYREGLTAKINESKEINKKKRACQAKIREFTTEIESLEAERNAIIKAINNRDLQSADDVKAAIKKLNNKMNTSTMSTAEETKTIKEIANLEQCVPKAVKLAEIKPKINELFQKR